MEYPTNHLYFLDIHLPSSAFRPVCLLRKYKRQVGYSIACERRRISGCRLSPPKNNVCEPEPGNHFSDVGILGQSQFSSSSPRTTARGIHCEEHSSFILSWNLIGQGETKVITSQKSFPASGAQTLFLGGDKRQPEICLRSQARYSMVYHERALVVASTINARYAQRTMRCSTVEYTTAFLYSDCLYFL